MARADIALLVAGAGLGISVLTFAWQITVFRLVGSRIDVRLLPVVLNIHGTSLEGPERGFPADEPLEPLSGDPIDIDLAVVRVANLGRTAETVSDISLDLGATSRLRPWRRHTVRGAPVDGRGWRADDSVRVEPGDEAAVAFDLWPLVEAGRARHPDRNVTVRGSARRPGGRRRRSRWHRRWTLGPDQQALRRLDTKAHHLQRIYVALWRATRRFGDENLTQGVWNAVQYSKGFGSEEDLRKLIGPVAPNNTSLAVAVVMAAANGENDPFDTDGRSWRQRNPEHPVRAFRLRR